MCEVCNGNHVQFTHSGSVAMWTPCPMCGPMPQDTWEQEMAELRSSIEALEQLLTEPKGA